jgi:hypothetical protein
MTDAVIIWVWGLVFFFAAIPGAVLGWIIGALFGSWTGATLSLVVSVIAGIIAAEKIYPGSLNAMSVGNFHAYYYPMFFHSAVSRGHAARSVDQQSHVKSPIV